MDTEASPDAEPATPDSVAYVTDTNVAVRVSAAKAERDHSTFKTWDWSQPTPEANTPEPAQDDEDSEKNKEQP